jgi:hypothetical protein
VCQGSCLFTFFLKFFPLVVGLITVPLRFQMSTFCVQPKNCKTLFFEKEEKAVPTFFGGGEMCVACRLPFIIIIIITKLFFFTCLFSLGQLLCFFFVSSGGGQQFLFF